MKRILIFIALCLTTAGAANAQETYNSSGNRNAIRKPQPKKGFDKDKLIFGGGIGLSFGDVTSIALAPTVGYRITDNFAAGIGLGFQYYRVKDFFEVYNGADYEYFPLKSTFFYPSVWARYVIYKNFFVHTEFEYDMQRFKVYDASIDPNTGQFGAPVASTLSYNSPAVLVGAGLRQPISDRASFVLIALYDVIQNKYSPYKNRVDFRVGLNVGF